MADPVLSVVVVIVSDTTGPAGLSLLRGCLRALDRQKNAPLMEIIVPHYPGVEGLESIRREFPRVRFLEITDLKSYAPGSREHHDELRARGMVEARGRIVALLEDHGAAAPDWSARLVTAHHADSAGIGGAIENGVDRALNWAVYFCDFLRYQNPLPAGESVYASDANVSYKREALEAIRPVWEQVFHETTVNWELRSRGRKLSLAPDVIVYQQRTGLRLGTALQERFIWGRSYAATRSGMAGPARRLFWAAFSPLLPALLLARMGLAVFQKRRTISPYCRAVPITALLLIAWSWGELAGYVTGRASGARESARAPLPQRSQAAG